MSIDSVFLSVLIIGSSFRWTPNWISLSSISIQSILADKFL